MKRLIIITTLLVAASTIQAQQLEQWTQFYMNEYMVNPTAAGSKEYFQANALYRDQWVGIQDSPRTYYLSVHGPIVKETMGIGGAVFSDVVGQTRRSGFQGTYAYHFKVADAYRLSFSLSTGMVQFSVDGGKLDLETQGDIALSNGYMSVWSLDFGSGARFEGEHFHVGLYVPQITGSKIQFFDDYAATENVLSRHYYLNAGYRYDFDDTWGIEGNFLGRYVTPMDMFDLQVRGIYSDMVWLGMSYRSPVISDQLPSAVGIMAGYQFQNNLTIGYAYDLDVGKISAATSGSHEIVLGIQFSKKNTAPVIPASEQ